MHNSINEYEGPSVTKVVYLVNQVETVHNVSARQHDSQTELIA